MEITYVNQKEFTCIVRFERLADSEALGTKTDRRGVMGVLGLVRVKL